jgi:hypothetical protein
MGLSAIFLIVALILFVIAAAGASSRFNLQSAGLAFLTAAFLVGAGIL